MNLVKRSTRFIIRRNAHISAAGGKVGSSPQLSFENQIELLPEDVRRHIFKTPPLDQIKKLKLHRAVESSLQHISSEQIKSSSSHAASNFTSLPLPGLLGISVLDHFKSIGEEFVSEFKALLDEVSENGQKVPRLPTEWSRNAGWTRYDPETGEGVCVVGPGCEGGVLVLDVEVSVTTSRLYPTLATALDPVRGVWYSWLSGAFWDEEFTYLPEDALSHLIPLMSDPEKPLIVIGHNVGFDRQYVQDEYLQAEQFISDGFKGKTRKKLRFWDTMAMHTAVCGLTNFLRNPYGPFTNLTPTGANEHCCGKNSVNKSLRQDQLKSGYSGSGSGKAKQEFNPDELFYDWTWASQASKANLVDAHRLHCGGFPLHMGHKEDLRGIFVSGSMPDIRDNFQLLTNYCADDVIATYKVFCNLYSSYVNSNPHPATMAGALIMGNTALPADGMWTKYLKNCEQKSDEIRRNLQDTFESMVHETIEEGDLNNVWLAGLDWTPVDLTKKKKSSELICAASGRSVVPTWFYNQIDRKEMSLHLTPRLRLIPLLLHMRYKGYPLMHGLSSGWGFLVPKSQDSLTALPAEFEDCKPFEASREDLSGYKSAKPKELEGLGFSDKVVFLKLPHPSGKTSQNVGTPINQEYMNLVESGVLTCDKFKDVLMKTLKHYKATSYWTANQDRLKYEQLHVLNTPQSDRGWILPKLCVHGTLTRRATESTWLVAMNAQTSTIGGELKSMVRAPSGFKFVGADVDSQEIWIAGLLGDGSSRGSGVRGHGVTPLGWMVVAGDKALRTDMHSYTAQQLGISRDSAKVINYARVYGAGMGFVKQYLEQNSNFDAATVKKKATDLMEATKGKEVNLLTKDASDLVKSLYMLPDYKNSVSDFLDVIKKIFNVTFDPSDLRDLLFDDNFAYQKLGRFKAGANLNLEPVKIKISSYSLFWLQSLLVEIFERLNSPMSSFFVRRSIVERKVYSGGTESETFTRLEEIATSVKPRTPFLGSLITRALQPANCGAAELPSRINWVVQSSAVDFLHLLLLAVESLSETYDVKMRFVLSIHDEVRYLVPDEPESIHRACWVLQTAHLLTRCFFSASLGINDLPASVAHFSAIDVDKVLRKEPFGDCLTLSNPEGLLLGHGVSHGEIMTAKDIDINFLNS